MHRQSDHTQFGPPRQSAKGFTLIELLVVIAIIGILAAILFPVFAQAKEAAKKANCISNLKNIALGSVLYVSDYDDKMFPIQVGSPAAGFTRLWFGGIVGSETVYRQEEGFLFPYLKSGPIVDCPSAKDITRHQVQTTSPYSYSLNRVLAGTTPDNSLFLADVQLQAETMLFLDAAFVLDKDLRKMYQSSTWFCNSAAPHGRHNGGQAGIAWIDGHVKSMKVSERPFAIATSSAIYNATAADMKRLRVGDLLRYPRVQVADITSCSVFPPTNHRDFYYYYADKRPVTP